MTHDNTGAVIPKFRSIGASKVFDPAQPVFALDHDVQNETPENLAKYAAIEAFAREHGIAFFPAKSGIGHQMMVEEGFVLPGTLRRRLRLALEPLRRGRRARHADRAHRRGRHLGHRARPGGRCPTSCGST